MASPRVLLVGWDAADWKVINPLMDAGKMPNVQRLIENGSMGQIATLYPALSPMLWTSIATGKRPFKHGIHGFSEPTPDGQNIQPVTNLSRKSKAVWNILNQHGMKSAVIGWWPSHPAEPIDGVMVSDHFHRASAPLDKPWPLLRNAVHPPQLAKTLADLRMHPDLLTQPMVEEFIPLAREIDQDKDRRMGSCMKILAECVSIHSAATYLLDHPEPDDRPWNFFAVYYDAIDHFCHGFMRYHPPRQRWISERDFELYSNVVNMAYQFHDQMLGTLLRRVGEETTVILMSDHGFHPDHLRPAAIPDIPAGPAIEHREYGILAIKGPGIRKDELLHGASVLDITPTILTVYGLPVGEDMDGKVLTQAFEEKPVVKSIPSWEEVPGRDGRHPPHTRLDPVAAHEAMEQMIALGYIERPDENREVAVENTIRELRYNLGEAYQDDNRHIEAHEIFAELHSKYPNEQRFAVRLFVSCQALGFQEEMRRIVDDLDGRRRALFEEALPQYRELQKKALASHKEKNPDTEDLPAEEDLFKALDPEDRKEMRRLRDLARYQPSVVEYLKAQVLTAEKKYAEALNCLHRVTGAHLIRPGLFLQTADLYLKLRRLNDAERVYRRALEIDPDNAQVYAGLAKIALRKRKFEEAGQAALDALQRRYNYPMAHFLLGMALIGLKEYERAAASIEAALSINPNFAEAHLRLAWLFEKYLSRADAAAEHRKLAKQMRGRRKIRPVQPSAIEKVENAISTAEAEPGSSRAKMPPVNECLVVVSGLPRSGTSMFMQMLEAGGMKLISDGLREADEDNPRGYHEYEPVKNLLQNSAWLREERGKAIKIVAPLLAAIPRGLPCKIIVSERDLDEVLDSQERMIARRKAPAPSLPDRRRLLKDEYARTMTRVKVMLSKRPQTDVLWLTHREAIGDPVGTAEKVNAFLENSLNAGQMATAIDPALHRNKS